MKERARRNRKGFDVPPFAHFFPLFHSDPLLCSRARQHQRKQKLDQTRSRITTMSSLLKIAVAALALAAAPALAQDEMLGEKREREERKGQEKSGKSRGEENRELPPFPPPLAFRPRTTRQFLQISPSGKGRDRASVRERVGANELAGAGARASFRNRKNKRNRKQKKKAARWRARAFLFFRSHSPPPPPPQPLLLRSPQTRPTPSSPWEAR